MCAAYIEERQVELRLARSAEDSGEAERHSGINPTPSERSAAGISIVQEVCGFVKGNLYGAQRRKDAASGQRGAGKGVAALVPASAHSECRSANSTPTFKG